MTSFPWKEGVDWSVAVTQAVKQLDKPHRYGFKLSCNVIDFICTHGTVSQAQVKEKFGLTSDGVATILSNVTMAIQRNHGGGQVWAPENGGWRADENSPRRYTVCPGFREAWNAVDKT